LDQGQNSTVLGAVQGVSGVTKGGDTGLIVFPGLLYPAYESPSSSCKHAVVDTAIQKSFGPTKEKRAPRGAFQKRNEL